MLANKLTGLFVAAAILLQGCAGPARKDAVPESLTAAAQVPGLTDVRFRIGVDNEAFAREGIDSVRREQTYLKARGNRGPMPPAVMLAISGGGDNGAFGAGLLNGWSATGNRPTFKLVTGVSTGALIAPFAFLGPKYDGTLKEFYTNTSPEDILEHRNPIAVVTDDALADNRPLWNRVAQEVDQAFLDQIAAEYEKGRLLMIATVDLDARQGVLWNMTRIAASRDSKALDLFRSIMVASASIPGAFPPTMIDVEASGRSYQEMHVDGGTMTQVFVYPPSLNVKKLSKELKVQRKRRVYVIRNSRLDAEWAQVDRRAYSIAGRAISTLIHSQGIGDLYRIYLTSQRDGFDFHLAYIPPDFDAPHKEEFDTEYMRALFKRGYDMAARGYPWEKFPPGYDG